MKTKSIFLILATVVATTFSYSQELSENYLNSADGTLIDSNSGNSNRLENLNRRATFKVTQHYANFQQFINNNIQFPEDARSLGASGDVIAHFAILADGSLGEIYFIKSPDPLFSKEVERVLRLAPQFMPAIESGKIVQSYEQVKVTFSLQ